ncbi:hypothetical protein K443DRAFT_215057 [Laccaria amethystina LaAM-08-1]|uniref:Uncharacterized protein n=1 Tax=Laccaria amethystina LaAM-08-1 TaxID=1095629 RepID=A0A0C9YGD0_9AGAR|nr:hypothetical protein K443DRAFT_215057 [Laccaria amethystina LaAM-08-1]
MIDVSLGTQCLFRLTTGFTTFTTKRQSLRLLGYQSSLQILVTNADPLIKPHQLTKPSAKVIENPAVFARIVQYLEYARRMLRFQRVSSPIGTRVGFLQRGN